MFDENHSQNDLMIFAATDGNCDAMSRALGNGAKVNWQDDCGQSALMIAAEYGHTKMVRMLLDAGADVHLKDYDGNTALHTVTSYMGSIECIEMLIGAGIDVNAFNDEKQTCFAVKIDSVLNDEFRQSDALLLLLENGANPFFVDKDGRTGLDLILQNAAEFNSNLLAHAQAIADKKVIASQLACVETDQFARKIKL